ncbi:indole-3-glycerol phosphate synthase [Haloarcula onubensis]|uniref:Indole-3-glycerol phosphate synthase n=1 Tax=Haloarcula onubensis TaxID=2950539 RepID=A0ABU2FK27_9EURY|nr:indole-3-glycerol phosphate synthase [Halomicroarcula sp. S3CR25-11]MDS0281109.1 indole-3-glycerol-phosphate synthase [Halomicroarcula sp. S3CR25-11]
MESDGRMAPAVESILAAARDRGGGGDRVAVEARSLPAAFERAEADGRVPVVAEVKPTSPTADGERTDDPVELARQMVDGGAAALSVLTEPDHFGGSAETLEAVREAVDVPVLRKDFILHEAQLDVVEADVILLIVRFLDEEGTDDLADLLAAARERGFQVLVEAHTADEVERAVDAGADIVGVNNRDLAKLEVDLATFPRAAAAAPEGVTLIAESGIGSPDDVRRMRTAGADALLVGSAIMDHGGDSDVTENTRRLTAAETTDADTQT